jgi:hypothetical protein
MRHSLGTGAKHMYWCVLLTCVLSVWQVVVACQATSSYQQLIG